MRFGADLSYLWKPIARPESYLFSRGNISVACRRKISVVASAVAAAMRITVKNNRKNANSESYEYNYEFETKAIFYKDYGRETTIFHVNLGQSFRKPAILTFEMHLNHLFTWADVFLTLYFLLLSKSRLKSASYGSILSSQEKDDDDVLLRDVIQYTFENSRGHLNLNSLKLTLPMTENQTFSEAEA